MPRSFGVGGPLLAALILIGCDDSASVPERAKDVEPDAAPIVDAAPEPDARVVDAEPIIDVAVDAEPDVVVDAEPIIDMALDAAPDVAVDAAPDVMVDAAPDMEPDAAPPPPDARLNELACLGEAPWVELVTLDGAPADLEGWWLSDRAAAPARRFIIALTLEAEGFGALELAEAPFDPCAGALFLGRPDGVIVDELVGAPPATGARGRLPDRAGEWRRVRETPGAPNEALVQGSVVLNEIDCQGRDWIEVFNPGEEPADLEGWVVTDRVDDPERGYPLEGVVQPGAFLAARQSQDGGPGFSFGVGCGNDTISLLDASGAVVDAVEIPELLDNTTWSRIPDGAEAWQPGEPTREAPNTPPIDEAAWLFEPTAVHTIALTVDDFDIERLRLDPRQPVDALIQINEHAPRAVGLRLKGRLGSFRALDRKSAFKLDFEFGGAPRFFGVEKLALNNQVQDRSKIHEFAAYALFRALGVAAPRTSYAQVTLNGEPYGLYAIIEVLDGPALDRWFVTTGHMYEGAYGQDLFMDQLDELDRDAGDNDRGQLYRLVSTLDGVSEAEGFAATLELIDWAQVAAMFAVEIWIGHWDGYAPTRNNYFLHFDGDEVLRMMPWGTDQTFDRRLDFYAGRGRLLGVCLADPDCKALFDQALVDVTSAIESLGLVEQITALAAQLRPLVEADPRVEHDVGTMDSHVERVLRFLADRAAQLEPLVACLTAEDRDEDDDGADCVVDCDDADPSVHPGAVDVCGDGIDQDCDGWPDDDLSCPDCVPIERAGHRYLACPTPRTYAEAEARCAEHGANLLRLDTAEEGRWIHAEATGLRRQRYWIGLTDRAEEGVFLWVDGRPLEAPRWQADQPDGGEAADCVAMIEDDGGLWADHDCEARHGVICEDPCASVDPDGDGVSVCAGDCAPEDPTAFPGALEICGNDVDEDCDQQLDDEDRCPRCEALTLGGRVYHACTSGRTAAEAALECEALGGALLSLETPEEHDRVMAALAAQGLNNLWLGLGDHVEEGVFVWASGAPLTYGRWRPDEPNDWGTGEDCAEAYANGWNDLSCDRSKPFACEPPCAPGTDLDGDGIDGCGADCDDEDPAVGVACPAP